MTKVIESIKKIYPEIKGGFVYWETKNNGDSWENPIDGLKWENKEYPKPTWEQIEANFVDLELEAAKNEKTTKCREYLKKTDWYCLRFADRGIEYPEEVKNKREQARNFTNDIEALTTLAEVEAFNIDAFL